MSENKKHSFRLVLDEKQHETLREIAFKLRTSKTALIRQAIEGLIQNYEEKKLEA